MMVFRNDSHSRKVGASEARQTSGTDHGTAMCPNSDPAPQGVFLESDTFADLPVEVRQNPNETEAPKGCPSGRGAVFVVAPCAVRSSGGCLRQELDQ